MKSKTTGQMERNMNSTKTGHAATKTLADYQRALRRAAEDAFQSDEIDTKMWELRDEGMTKECWIEDKMEEWLSAP